MADEPILKFAADASSPPPQSLPPPARTSRQIKTDLIIQRIKAEIRQDFPDLKSDDDDLDPLLVDRDGKIQVWLIVCKNDRDPATGDRLIKSAIWTGKEIDTFDHYNQGVREYLMKARSRKWSIFFGEITSPLTIGAMIGVLLVLITAFQLFRAGADKVPEQLWTVLTAVIAFYFGRGGRRSDRDGEDD